MSKHVIEDAKRCLWSKRSVSKEVADAIEQFIVERFA